MVKEVLYEFVQQGNSLKVCAIDPETNTEVSIVGPPHYERDTLKMWARRKLERVVRKKKWANRKRRESRDNGFYA